jgi:hypothetical protein
MLVAEQRELQTSLKLRHHPDYQTLYCFLRRQNEAEEAMLEHA